jgi:hypothetical protein
MIDPDNIQIQDTKLPNLIKISNVPEFDYSVYDTEDEKGYEKYIKIVEQQVRRSYEYKAFIKYARDNMGMNKCSFLKNVSNEETFDIKIEIHHYPFSLRDICDIVYRKRVYYSESISVQMVAKEVMELHYKLMVGLIPLSETVHKLFHNGRLFIPVDKVVGRYNLFVDYYKPFISPEQLETLSRIEKYTEERNDINDTTIIDQNKVTYEVNNDRFKLPEFANITDEMISQIQAIKDNNYALPTVDDTLKIEDKSTPIKPIVFLTYKEPEKPIIFLK